MAKIWSMALALLVSAGLWAAPAMAQSSDVNDVGKIERGGQAAEEGTSTKLDKGGLSFMSKDFSLNMTTRVQFRLTYQNEVGNGNDGANGADFLNFRVRRAKTKFSGHIFEKEFQYELLLNWATGGDGIVEEAIFTWALMNEFNINAGQQKLQFNWEEATSSGRQQFVDRSYTNEVFNVDYGKGIWVNGDVSESMLKYWFGIYNGVLKANNDFRNADGTLRSDSFSNLVDTEMMINLRLETHPLGEVKRSMYDGRGEDERDQVLFAIGLGVNWFSSGFNDAGIRADTVAGATGSGRFRTSQDTWTMVLDGHLRLYGLSVDLELFFRHTEFHNRGRNRFDPTGRAGTGNLTDMGFSALVAYMILPEQLNVGLRFAMVNADEVWQGGSTSQQFGVRPDTTEFGLSVNYFVHGDNLKLTLDVLMVNQQLPFALSSSGLVGVYNTPPARSGASVAGEVADNNALMLIRLQLQWIF